MVLHAWQPCGSATRCLLGRHVTRAGSRLGDVRPIPALAAVASPSASTLLLCPDFTVGDRQELGTRLRVSPVGTLSAR